MYKVYHYLWGLSPRQISKVSSVTHSNLKSLLSHPEECERFHKVTQTNLKGLLVGVVSPWSRKCQFAERDSKGQCTYFNLSFVLLILHIASWNESIYYYSPSVDRTRLTGNMVDLLVESSEQVVLALGGSGYIIQRFALYYFLSVDFFFFSFSP